jgi:hypothetical protein
MNFSYDLTKNNKFILKSNHCKSICNLLYYENHQITDEILQNLVDLDNHILTNNELFNLCIYKCLDGYKNPMDYHGFYSSDSSAYRYMNNKEFINKAFDLYSLICKKCTK